MRPLINLASAGRRWAGFACVSLTFGFASMALLLPNGARAAYLQTLAFWLLPWTALVVCSAGLAGARVERTLRALLQRMRQLDAPTASITPEPTAPDELGDLAWRIAKLHQQFQEALVRLRELRQQAEQRDRSKGQWLDAMRHELRTPLHAVLGFSDVLLSEIDGPLQEAQREDLRVIRSAGQHLKDLFNDVLDLSAAAGGQLALEPSDIDLPLLVGDAVAAMRAEAASKSIELRLRLPEGFPTVRADARRLRQVLGNLLNNALKFTDSGSITVHLGHTPDAIVMQVQDTGVGVPEAELPNIFEEFQRGSHGLRHASGLGLGLAISKRLVELHGGRLEVESQAGRGSTFSVHLPRKTVA